MCRCRKGPPVAISVDLDRNLRTRAKGVSTFVDTLDLAEGRINTLKRMDFRDANILERLRRHLHYTENKTTPWRLLINLEHEFAVEPEYSEPDHLLLRVDLSSTAGRIDCNVSVPTLSFCACLALRWLFAGWQFPGCYQEI